MQLAVDITDFTAGELSPRLKGRTDYKKYYSGLDTGVNMVVMPQGGATKRPGTLFVALNKLQASRARLKDFVFSNKQPYVLQFSNGNVRIHKNDATLLNGGNPVDVAVPYQLADLAQMKFAQSADTLFIAHPNYPPASLSRSGSTETTWTYTVLTFQDGPYLSQNTNAANMVTPSGTSGAITLTWTNQTNINGGAGFTANDIGRAVRVQILSLWAWCVITGIVSATEVNATVQAQVNNGAAGAMDGANWASGKIYVKGTVVQNSSSKFYICVTGGVSGTNGPVGDGLSILDGSAIWASLTAFQATQWTQSTVYDLGDIVYSPSGGGGSGGYYQAEIAGKSSSGGSGPTGTGSGITDASITWNFLPPFTLPTSTKNWALGAYSPGNGYPYAVRFWQQRLLWGGFPQAPNQVFGSSTADFLNHAPTASDGTVLDTNALSWVIDDDKVQAIQWMVGAGSAQAQQLAMGTAAGEQVLQAASTSQALTPLSVQAYGETAYGGAPDIDPLRIGKAVLFLDRTGRKVREWAFYWQMGGYNGPDINQASEHILKAFDGSNPLLSGLAQWVYQQAPHQVIWGFRNDGALLSFTYDRDQQVWAPMRHFLGGQYYGGPPVVESLAVIPSPDNTYDELWLSVLRTINGVPTRTVEVMTRYFDGQPQDLAFFADCGLSSPLTYPNATITPAGFTNANASDAAMPPAFSGTGTFSASAAVFAGNATDVGLVIRIAGGKAVVTAPIDTQNVTAQVIVPLLNMAPAAANAWSATAKSNAFSGTNYLGGETVTVLGDGAAIGTQVAPVSGNLVLPNNLKVSLATIGLPYTAILVTMPFEPVRAAAAAANGKIKKISEMWMRLHETLGVFFGRRETDPMTNVVSDKTEPIDDRTAGMLMGNAPTLFSGMKRCEVKGDWDREGQIVLFQKDPLPMTVLSLVANADVEEMPVQEAA